MYQNILRILIVDDYAIVREGLIAMLDGQPDIVLVGTASNGAEALSLVQTTCPNVVLLDLVMPTMDGMDSLCTLHAIKQVCPDARIIMLISLTDDEHIHTALKAGAAGYLHKDAGRVQVLNVVRNLSRCSVGPQQPGDASVER